MQFAGGVRLRDEWAQRGARRTFSVRPVQTIALAWRTQDPGCERFYAVAVGIHVVILDLEIGIRLADRNGVEFVLSDGAVQHFFNALLGVEPPFALQANNRHGEFQCWLPIASV